MSDTSTQPSTADSLNSVLKSAPELGSSPGLAVGVASAGGDTAGNAQAVARTTNAVSDSHAAGAVEKSAGGGIGGALNWFGNSVSHAVSDVASPVVGAVKTGVTDVGKVLNAPLAQVQHEYRYLHDVEARHGAMAAVMEGLGVAAGAGIGAIAGGGYGAVLGGEIAAGIEGQFFYKDSYQRTANGATYTDPHTHQSVSVGRDIASVLGLRPGTTTYNIGSGLIDGIADLNVGGGEVMGLARDAKSAAGAKGLLGNYFPGVGAATAEDFEQAYTHYGPVQNAMKDIAGKSAGEILATPAYQSLNQIAPRASTDAADVITGNDFVKALGQANTQDDVAQVFREALRTHELVGMDTVPTLSYTRIPFQAIREAAENSDGITSNVARKFIRLPSAAGEDGSISMKTFDPSSPTDNGAVGLYRMLMYTETRRTAASVVNEYVNAATLQDRIRIYRQSTMNTLQAMTEQMAPDIRPTPSDLKDIKAALDDLTGGAEPGVEGMYGMDERGRNLAPLRDESDGGRQYSAAITDNQTGQLRFVQLGEMRAAAHTLTGYRGLFGNVAKADGFLYRNITQRLFKPLVLLTPSYALHISLAELIPNTLRLGVRNIVRDAVALNAAKLGERAVDGDAGALSGLVWRLLAGPDGKALTADPEDLGKFRQRIQLATRYVESMGGDYVPPGLSSSHNYSREVDREFRNQSLLHTGIADTPMMRGSQFGSFGQGDKGFMESWQDWLNELSRDKKTQIAADRIRSGMVAGKTLDQASEDASAAVATWLREQPKSYLDRYLRSKETSNSLPDVRPAGADQFDDWGHVVVKNLRGATRAQNLGPMNDSLLGHIANGEHVQSDELHAIDDHLRPGNVKGRKITPAPAENVVQKVANVGFERLLNPMVNFLSRQPIAFTEFEKQYGKLAPLVDKGVMDEDEAMTSALAKTSAVVIRNVHNLTDRTQWTVTLRNWAPFFFAQEQAYRRMGRLLASNPRAFRSYMLEIFNLHDVGQLTNQNGQQYFVVPGTGYLTSGMAAGLSGLGMNLAGSSPVGMGWNLSSASVIFPLSQGARVDLGPVAAIPIQAIADFFPEMGAPALKADITGVSNFAVGSSSSSPLWEQFIPNTIVQRLVQTAVADQGGQVLANRSFNSSMMQAIAILDYDGHIPSQQDAANPQTAQTFNDRVRNFTRILYFTKAILGAITPVSPEVQFAGDNLRTTYDADVAAWSVATQPGSGTLTSQGFSMNQLGFPKELNDDIKSAGSLSKGILAYLHKHPDATAKDVFLQTEGAKALPFTVSQSATPSGAYIPASDAAETWINDHASLINSAPMAAFYLMPQMTDNQYSATIYNEQLAQGYRVKLNPTTAQGISGQTPSFLAQLYVAAGNATVLDKWYPAYEKAIAGQSGETKYQTEQAFYNKIATYSTQNPIWGQWWNTDTKTSDRSLAVTQLQTAFSKGEVPQSAFSDEIKGLLTAYGTYSNSVKWGTQDHESSQEMTDIKSAWQKRLVTAKQYYPELSTFIDGVLLNLPAQGVSNG